MAKRDNPKKLDGEKLRKEGRKWIERIDAAWTRETEWMKNAEMAVKAYTNEASYYPEGSLYDYNILHSNVETIVPAIINSPPVPDIRQRFDSDDETARDLANLLERAISVQIDDSKLANELESQAQDGFLAGRGVVRVRFYADIEPNEVEALEEAEDELKQRRKSPGNDEMAGDGSEDDADSEDGKAGSRYGSDDVSNEHVCYEAVSWRDYQHGPAKRWQDRPWESFRHVCEDMQELADPDYWQAQQETDPKPSESKSGDYTIYEIWDKKKKQVHFISAEGIWLKSIDDPLELECFFPAATPVQPLTIVGRLMPVNPFSIYKKLAEELDIQTKRIKILTRAMQLKGGFVGGVADDLKRLAEADDNELIAISGVEAVAGAGSLDNLISWWPIDRYVQVLRELVANREQTKQAIYEITGISDIVRGASKASETLGAQQIKSQWGSLRIKKMQTLMANSARELISMTAEIIMSKFSHETLQEMTGVQLIVPEQLRQPLPSPQLTGDPQRDQPMVQQWQQAMQERQAQIDKIERLAALLTNKKLNGYRVDIETDSTVRADLTQKKSEMAEFLNGTAQYFAAMAPVVQSGGASVAKPVIDLYAAASRVYDLGKGAEDALDQMIAAAEQSAEAAANAPPQPNPDVIKAQSDAESQKAKLQLDQQKQMGEAQKAAAEFQMRQAELQANQQLAREKLQADVGIAMEESRQRMSIEQAKAANEAAKAQSDLALKQADLALKTVDMQIKEKDLALKQKQLDAPVNTGASNGNRNPR